MSQAFEIHRNYEETGVDFVVAIAVTGIFDFSLIFPFSIDYWYQPRAITIPFCLLLSYFSSPLPSHLPFLFLFYFAILYRDFTSAY